MPQFSTTTKKTKQKKELKNGCKTIEWAPNLSLPNVKTGL